MERVEIIQIRNQQKKEILEIHITLPSNLWAKVEITKKSGMYFELNGNENTTCQNLCEVTKSRASWENYSFKCLDQKICQIKRSQTNNLNFYPKYQNKTKKGKLNLR